MNKQEAINVGIVVAVVVGAAYAYKSISEWRQRRAMEKAMNNFAGKFANQFEEQMKGFHV